MFVGKVGNILKDCVNSERTGSRKWVVGSL